MANNLSIKDGTAATRVVKTTDNSGIHTSHMNVDASALPTGAATVSNQVTMITHLAAIEVAAEDPAPVLIKTPPETTNTPSQVVVAAATSTVLSTPNAARIRFTIYNPTASIAYVRKATAAASATAFDFPIPAGETYFSEPYEWTGEIRIFSTPGGTFNISQAI